MYVHSIYLYACRKQEPKPAGTHAHNYASLWNVSSFQAHTYKYITNIFRCSYSRTFTQKYKSTPNDSIPRKILREARTRSLLASVHLAGMTPYITWLSHALYWWHSKCNEYVICIRHASMLPAPTQSDTLPGWHCRACIGRRIRPFVLCTRLRVLCVVGGNNLLRNGSSILDTVMFASGLARMLVRCCYCHIQHQ